VTEGQNSVFELREMIRETSTGNFGSFKGNPVLGKILDSLVKHTRCTFNLGFERKKRIMLQLCKLKAADNTVIWLKLVVN